MNAKLLLRWFIPVLVLLVMSLGCDMNEVADTYFPPLSTFTKPPPANTATYVGPLLHSYDKIECNVDENTHYYTVSAYDHSTAKTYLNTDLYINPGTTVEIMAGGIACCDPNPDLCCGPDGFGRGGGLVGKIGNGKMFAVGSNFERTFDTEAGMLYLAYNDSDYENNSGFYEVCVTVY